MTVQDQLEKDKEQMRADIVRSSQETYNALVVNPMSNLAKLPEEIFVNSFLPYFSGKKSIAEDPSIFSYWIGIAGSPTSEVQIIDAAGNKLYTVPPMSDSNTVDISKGAEGTTMQEIIVNYTLYKNVTPMKGKNYLDSALDVKADELVGKSDYFKRNEQRWAEIFKRYGISPVPGKQESDAVAQSDSDELEYD